MFCLYSADVRFQQLIDSYLIGTQSQGMLEQTANGATRLGRAGFRLTAVRPRALHSRSTGSGNNTPLSHSPAQVYSSRQ